MAIVAVSLSPVGEGVSVGADVARALAVLKNQDRVRWELGAMFTTLEGELPEIFDLILAMREAIFEAGALRVGAVIKVDERRDRSVSIDDKLASVEARLEDQ